MHKKECFLYLKEKGAKENSLSYIKKKRKVKSAKKKVTF